MELESLNKELNVEKEKLSERSRELETELDDLKRVHNDLNAKHQKTLEEHAEAVRNLKVREKIKLVQ